MAQDHGNSLQTQLIEAGLDISSGDFISVFRRSLDRQRAALHGASEAEMSAEEAAAYEAGGFDLKPRVAGDAGPLESTLAEFAAMISESRSIDGTAKLLGVDRSRVHQRLTSKTLYGFRRGGRPLIPLFQFDHGKTLPGLEKVLPVLDPGAHPLAVFRFFMTPQPDLLIEGADGEEQISPRDWLRLEMDPTPVAELARDLASI